MRAGTLSEQNGTNLRSVRCRSWQRGNQDARIVTQSGIGSADGKASASLQEPDPFMDVVLIEQARGTELLNPPCSRTGETNEISVFVERTGKGIDGLDEGAWNPSGAVACVTILFRRPRKHLPQLAYVFGNSAIGYQFKQAQGKLRGRIRIEPVAVIAGPVSAARSDVGNEFATKRGEWRPGEIGTAEAGAFGGGWLYSVDVVTHEFFLLRCEDRWSLSVERTRRLGSRRAGAMPLPPLCIRLVGLPVGRAEFVDFAMGDISCFRKTQQVFRVKAVRGLPLVVAVTVRTPKCDDIEEAPILAGISPDCGFDGEEFDPADGLARSACVRGFVGALLAYCHLRSFLFWLLVAAAAATLASPRAGVARARVAKLLATFLGGPPRLARWGNQNLFRGAPLRTRGAEPLRKRGASAPIQGGVSEPKLLKGGHETDAPNERLRRRTAIRLRGTLGQQGKQNVRTRILKCRTAICEGLACAEWHESVRSAGFLKTEGLAITRFAGLQR